MSLTGLFLILFLVVHLLGNLQLLYNDGGEAFNVYAYFMVNNPLIKTISYSLYAFILIHTIQGLILWSRNRAARGAVSYAVKRTKAVNTSAMLSSRMGWLGVIILVFLIIHLVQFWLKMKMGVLPVTVTMEGAIPDLYTTVAEVYKNVWFVIFYVVCMIVVGMHLWHGFQSAFQTLGLNHKKYSPAIRFIGKAYSILIPAGFALIPIMMYMCH